MRITSYDWFTHADGTVRLEHLAWEIGPNQERRCLGIVAAFGANRYAISKPGDCACLDGVDCGMHSEVRS